MFEGNSRPFVVLSFAVVVPDRFFVSLDSVHVMDLFICMVGKQFHCAVHHHQVGSFTCTLTFEISRSFPPIFPKNHFERVYCHVASLSLSLSLLVRLERRCEQPPPVGLEICTVWGIVGIRFGSALLAISVS